MWDAAGVGIILGYGMMWLLLHPWPYLPIFIVSTVLLRVCPAKPIEHIGPDGEVSYEEMDSSVKWALSIIFGACMVALYICTMHLYEAWNR